MLLTVMLLNQGCCKLNGVVKARENSVQNRKTNDPD